MSMVLLKPNLTNIFLQKLKKASSINVIKPPKFETNEKELALQVSSFLFQVVSRKMKCLIALDKESETKIRKEISNKCLQSFWQSKVRT